MAFTPTQVDDRKDRELIVSVEQRMRITEDKPMVMGDRSYTLRRNSGEMLWSVYSDGYNAPVGYLAAQLKDGRLDVEAQDNQGRALGQPEHPVAITRALARVHDWLIETGAYKAT